MNSYQKAALEKLLRVYDFVTAHPACSVYQLCTEFGLRTSAMRDVLHQLRDSGHVVCKPGARSRAGQLPSEWTITYKDRPDAPPPARKKGRKCKPAQIIQPARIEDAKRIITRAKQIGMAPDPFALPASFFHPAAVSA